MPIFIHRLAKPEMDWATTVSRRAWSTKLRPICAETPKKMEQFSVGEDEDDYDDPVYWFVGLRGGVYSLKRYTKIKSS
jgi:hypothetical protein